MATGPLLGPGPAFTDTGSVSSTSRQKLPSGERSILMHHDRSECERTIPGISENYSCWLHNSPHTAVSPQGVAAWGSSVSVTALIHRPSSPSSSAGLNETGLRAAPRFMTIISPSWAWAQALAQLEWHHHLVGNSCPSLARQKHFYNCNGHISSNTRAMSNVSLKFQQTIHPEFGRIDI